MAGLIAPRQDKSSILDILRAQSQPPKSAPSVAAPVPAMAQPTSAPVASPAPAPAYHPPTNVDQVGPVGGATYTPPAPQIQAPIAQPAPVQQTTILGQPQQQDTMGYAALNGLNVAGQGLGQRPQSPMYDAALAGLRRAY